MMASLLRDLQPSLLWKHFEEILKIPHCSGNERVLGDYIISAAKNLGFSWKRDEAGNVLVEKKASPGHDASEGVILQCHLDMVCEKNSDAVHDFSKDPIESERKGEWIQARGTTLGSDNGIGIAASLAVMESQNLVHGPLEFLFTVDEETGLTGAKKIEAGFLKGKKLLNLDSEEEGTFTIGCAGGGDSEIHLPLRREKAKEKTVFRLKLGGFRGGHSGLDIHLGRGNAIKLLARILWDAQRIFPLRLIRIEGGNKRNAIPREAWAEFFFSADKADSFSSFLQEAFHKIQKEFQAVEKEVKFSLEKIDGPEEDALTSESQKTLLGFLFSLPHGVLAMHPEIPGLVETSNNVAIVQCFPEKALIVCSSRSSVSSALEATKKMIQALSELVAAEIRQPAGYPGWTPNLQSPLLQTLKRVYFKVFQKEAVVKAVHAGLECGILGEKFPDLDMISFGPTIEHPHSPEEKVHIQSVENFWKFLTAAIQELA